MSRCFLLEIGCEEIPAPMILPALQDLQSRLLEALGGPEGLSGHGASPPTYGGPRRLVACLTGLRDREEDRVVQVTGPPIKAAYDASGRPTAAALGFARAQQVRVEDLDRVATEKGEVVAARRRIAGRSASSVLAEACPRIISALRFPKQMKWGDRGHSFVRPIHWIVALLDAEVVDFELMGIRSGRLTRGHRTLAPGPHEIPHASLYEEILTQRGRVVPGHEARRSRIQAELREAAASRGWSPPEDDELLAELTFLSENPHVIAGAFPESFLDLPAPILITAMRHHQKYFPARRCDALAPGFLAVINLDGDPEGTVRRGNEWVLKARLSDARFFWGEDRRKKLSDRVADLHRITFQEKLGSNLSRAERLTGLAARLADGCHLPAEAIARVRQAARLSKADLTTGVVGEFPELQGVMGGIYARDEGLPEEVARAIEEHYRPVSADGPLPETLAGCLIALADKLDLLAGCFACGLIPKGSADPYALRRAAHGACRILLSETMGQAAGRITLAEALKSALDQYAAQGITAPDRAATEASLAEFLGLRLRHLMEARGVMFDTARAVLACGFDDPSDAWERAEALTSLRGPQHEDDFLALAGSAKRIRNILSQAAGRTPGGAPGRLDPAMLVEAEERDLHQAIREVDPAVDAEIGRRDYRAALLAIASLRPRVDRFFEKVLVMAPDEGQRRSRLALLEAVGRLLDRVADFSEIVVEGERPVGAGASDAASASKRSTSKR